MMEICIAPDCGPTLEEAVESMCSGGTIRLEPGHYEITTPIHIKGRHFTEAEPLVIQGQAGVVLDAVRSPDPDYSISDPGIGSFAVLKIVDCSWVCIEKVVINRSWPTAIQLENASNITIREVWISEGTFAIYARGPKTRHITVEKCQWRQSSAIWDKIPWAEMHDGEGMDIDGRAPHRYFNGAFFGSVDIPGDVIIRDNKIQHAFNGIRLDSKTRADHLPFNRNIQIYGNSFSYIRDNPVEMEKFALNWWVHHNQFFNCHAWFSMDGARGGYWYVFGNIGWFDAKPGPDWDENNGGKVFKMSKKKFNIAPDHDWYVFNNSWYLRCSYTKKAWTKYLKHWNNAIEYCRKSSHPAGDCSGNRFFGDQVELCVTDDVVFAGDICTNPTFLADLKRIGLKNAGRLVRERLFREPENGNFCLRDPVNKLQGVAFTVTLPNRETWSSKDACPPADAKLVGAVNRTGCRFKGPSFVKVDDNWPTDGKTESQCLAKGQR